MRTGKIKIKKKKKKEEKRFTSEKYQHWEFVAESHLLEKAVSFRKSSFLKQQSGRGAGGLLRFPLMVGTPCGTLLCGGCSRGAADEWGGVTGG